MMLTPEHYLIKHRRNGSTIYRCPHHTHYLKIGSHEEIMKEVRLYEYAQSYGFPLPKLLGFDVMEDDLAWMKESVVPGRLYADIFTEDCEQTGYISNKHWQEWIRYQQQHLQHQYLTTSSSIIDYTTFDRWWYLLREENVLDTSIIDKLYEYIVKYTSYLPLVWNHGDHNAYNIFDGGIIDLEDSFFGPIGYDTITSLTQNYWFPVSGGELCQQHRHSVDQFYDYIKLCSDDRLMLTDPDIFTALMLMRGIFVTVGSHETPLLEKMRYDKLQAVVQAWIGGQDMIKYYLDHYQTVL